VAVRTADTDGYDAVQLAFDEVSEGKLSKPKLGHLKKHNVGPHRKLVEIRGPHELAPGETVTVESFEPGEKVKVSILTARALPGRSSGTTSAAAP
jgi:large subunit ribosomal protein L3